MRQLYGLGGGVLGRKCNFSCTNTTFPTHFFDILWWEPIPLVPLKNNAFSVQIIVNKAATRFSQITVQCAHCVLITQGKGYSLHNKSIWELCVCMCLSWCMYVREWAIKFIRAYVSYNKELHNLATNPSIKEKNKSRLSWQMSFLKQQEYKVMIE